MDSYERALQAEDELLRQQVLEQDMLLRLALQVVISDGGRADRFRLVD